jgi:hypothetical protein
MVVWVWVVTGENARVTVSEGGCLRRCSVWDRWRDVMMWWMSCVRAVCGMGGGDMGCVCESWMLRVVVSRFGEW